MVKKILNMHAYLKTNSSLQFLYNIIIEYFEYSYCTSQVIPYKSICIRIRNKIAFSTQYYLNVYAKSKYVNNNTIFDI